MADDAKTNALKHAWWIERDAIAIVKNSATNSTTNHVSVSEVKQVNVHAVKLDEDFVFDADEAFQKPDSDSAKVLGATIDGVVQRRLSNVLKSQRQENAKMAKEAQFKQKMEMSEDEWSRFTDFAKSKSLELEDIYYLMNRKNRDSQIADSARQEIHNKMREVQSQPGTLATQGSTQVEKSHDDSVFDSILGSGSELEKAFSI